jgi:hypothetical protein
MPKVKDYLNSRLAKVNGWIYRTPYESKDSFEDQMNKILDVLESKINILKSTFASFLVLLDEENYLT